MENGLCFGKWYSGEAQECQLCEVREECMLSMQDEKKMPCFKQYDSENYACLNACHLGGEPNVSACAAAVYSSEEISDEPMEVVSMEGKVEGQEPVAVAAEEQVAKEPVAEAVPAVSVEEAVLAASVEEAVPAKPEETPSEAAAAATKATAAETTAAVSPDAVQADKPGKKLSKKDVIRNALAESPDGISADDIVQKIIDADLATEANSDKTRHYVIMSISHIRKAGSKVDLKEGKYVLAGVPSESGE